MALKEKQTSLMASNNATYKTVEGVTYFKLKSEFDGDYTKHCGLLGEEIDENFYFLRGYDIESITVDKDRNLIINRVDKDYAPLVVNIGEELGQPSFKFNKETGTITVTYPDGTTSTMEGFLVEGKDIRIATDSTLDGNGTMYNPLRISLVETTGTFAPADEYFDLTDGTLMKDILTKGNGYRIVTKEKIDNFGCLYPFSAVKKVQDKLTEDKSQWRVPTKQDWDELLNAYECAEYRNHSANTCDWRGNVAGRALKSFNLWEAHKTTLVENETYGEDTAGLSIYPLGITPDRNELLNDDNNDAEGFGKLAGLWTSTLNEEGNAYVKVFGYNSGKVDQDTYGEGARMSIRLVKDYTYSNYKEIETILGFPYPTKMVYGIYEDNPYIKIWTTINLYSDAETLGGVRSDEWNVVSDSDRGVKIVYFINEWDGTEWHKKPMGNGDSVVILSRTVSPSISYYMKKYNIKTGTYEYIQLTKAQGEDAIKQGFVFTELNILPPASDNTPEYVVIEKIGGEAFCHEWRIIEGELVDTADAIINEFNKELNEVKEDIYELSTTTQELVQFSGWVVETINEFSAATEEHINRINNTITEVSAITTTNIERIDNDVKSVSGAVDTVSAITTANIERIDNDVKSVSGAVDTVSAITTANIERIDSDVMFVSGAVDTVSAITTANIERIDGDVIFVSGAVDTVSAITTANIERIDSDVIFVSGAVDTVSAITTANIERIDSDVIFVSGAVDTVSAITTAFSASTVEEIARLDKRVDDEAQARIDNDITPGTYVLSGDASSEMVIPTYSVDVEDVKIKVSESFFNFGTFENNEE